ncbi:MAG: ATP-binding cassette subfamily B protein [Myxococcota bacterium]
MNAVFKFYRTHGPPHWRWYLAGLFTLLCTNFLSVRIPVYLGRAVDVIKAGGDNVQADVSFYAGVIAAMGVGIIVVRTLSRVAFFTPGRLVEAEVKRNLFQKLLRQQLPFHQVYPAGDLISRSSSDVGYVRLLAGFGAFGIVNTAIALIMAIAQMTEINAFLAAVTMVPVILALLSVRVFIKRMFRLVHKMQKELAQLSDHVLSTYQGIATVKSFAAEDAFAERFDRTNRDYLRTSEQRADMRALIGPILAFAATLNVFVLLYFGGPMAIREEITVGELVAFIALTGFLAGPIRGASFLLSVFKQAEAALQRIDEVADPLPERPDLPNPVAVPPSCPELRVEHLTFAYPDAADVPVLQDIELVVPPGTTLGIMGATGSGKTTLIRMLTRLFNPPAGTVFVDGIDICTLDLDAWRRTLAVVPQRAFLFSESVRDNILLGAPDDGRLERVLEATTMDVDIAALPQGTETLVGESGVMLSGGQRQRTALARGLIRDHTLLVLDDVLSAVDHKTEHQLIAAMRSGGPSTSIIVANRISAIQHADQIIVLEDGRIVQRGDHASLLTEEGVYRDIWERQSDSAA